MKGSTPIVRIAIYLRKSRADDGVQDLAKHKEYLISICERNNWTYELYEEIESSQDLFRPELQRMRQDISLGKIDAVMVHAVDRLSRRQRHFLEIIEDYFLDQGVTKLFVQDTEHDLTDSTVITMLQITATLSQAEYSFIVKRLNEGRRASIKKGILTGKVVYGYYNDKETQTLRPHPVESKLVRMMIDLLLEGEPYKAICDKINSLGYRTRVGNLWDIYNIKSIVHSHILRGHIIQDWKDEHIEIRDNHEAIMSEAEYAKIKEITENRAKHYKGLSKAPTHWLQGILRCPLCNKVMTIAGTKPKRKKLPDGTVERSGDYVYYIRACRPYIKGGERCPNKGCQASLIEEYIREIVKEYQSAIRKKMELLSETDVDEVISRKAELVADLKKAISKLESKEEGLLDLLLDQTIDKSTYNNRINKLKEEKATLIMELTKAEESLSAVDVEMEMKHQSNLNSTLDRWDSLTGEQKRQTLQLVFKEIQYTRLGKDVEPVLDVVPY